ncbi:LCP family protein [Bacillus testis]|uniref:LCP family protein n=1 Tax=Bacillus testis TaxID=1622072 RepID=UPI00067E7883|nr:LCP family protein [Bacillus testis]
MASNRKVYVVTKRKKSRKKLAMFILTPILVLLFGTVGYVATLYTKAEQVADQSYEPLDRSSKAVADLSNHVDNMSILFIGVDDSQSRNYKDSTRSDALLLATFNKKLKTVKLLSIPRDSYVYVPDKGDYTKINHAYALGGARGSVETVEKLLDIPVDYYVRMNFYALIDIVDALGGIEVNVPYEMYEKDSKDRGKAIHLEKGVQVVNGEEALAFTRTRKQDNDMERGKRQQEVIQAIVKKAATAQALTKYTDVMETVGENMKTNFTFSQIKSLMAFALKNNDMEIENLQLQGQDATIDGVYYYQLDDENVEEISDTLKEHLETTASSKVAQETAPQETLKNQMPANSDSSEEE